MLPFVELLEYFGSRYASKSIKGSKDVDHNLVSNKNLSQKIAHWVGTQGQVNSPKMAKHALILRKPQTQNKIF